MLNRILKQKKAVIYSFIEYDQEHFDDMTRIVPKSIGEKFQDIYPAEKILSDHLVVIDIVSTKNTHSVSKNSDIEYPNNEKGSCAISVMLYDKERHYFHLHHECHKGPCFRYDATGHVHVNQRKVSKKLTERIVPSPHFHKFTEDGIEYAYRTPVIDTEEEALKDIEFSFDVFCKEGNIKCNDSTIPSVQLAQSLFPSATVDPLEGHQFP